MLGNFTPAAVVINEAMDILHFRGNTSPYLQQTPGKPTHNLLKMAKPDLAFELRNIIHKTIKQKKPVKKENIPVELNGLHQFINLEVIPLTEMVEPHYLLIFNDSVKIISGRYSKSTSGNNKDEDILRMQQLEEELAQLREDIRSITEEQEASNEELQSTNEELLSSNEELQSLNEELETSKEELQSTVEELTVVNQEMVNLNEQLTNERDYADAIIATIPQPLLILDKDLSVTLANQLFYDKFQVKKNQTEEKLVYEIGNRQWDIPELKRLLEEILPHKKSLFGFEIEHNFDHIGYRHLRLNASEITKVNGEKRILLVIEDVTAYVEAAKKIAQTEHRYASMIYSSPFMIAILEGKDMIIKDANDAILATWGKSRDVIGKSLMDVMPQVKESGRNKILNAVFETGEPYYGYEVPVEILQHNKKETAYYTFIYQAQKDIAGKVEGVAILAHEVTSQAVLNRKIKQSEQKIKDIVTNAPFPIAVYEGADLKIELANQAILDVWGKGNNVIGKGFREILPELENQKIFEQLDAVLKTGVSFHAKNQQVNLLIDEKLQPYYFNYNFTPLYNEAGQIYAVMNTAADVTDINVATQKLEESKEQFSTLADNMENLAWTADGEGWIYWYNKRWYDYTGTTLEEMQGWGWQKVHHPDHKERVIEFVKKAWHINKPLLGADGNYRWFLTRAFPIADETGKIIRWLGTNTDITNQIETEQRLSLLSTIVESSGDAIISKTLNSIITTWNIGAEKMFGYSASEIIGKSINVLIPEELQQEEDMVIHNIKNGQPVNYETVRQAKDGRKLNVSLSISPINDKDGNIIGASKIARDITEQVIARKKIEESEEQFRKLSDQAPMWVWLTDKEVNILYANTEVLNFIGIKDASEFTGRVWEQKVHPEDIGMVYQSFANAVSLQKPFSFELRVQNEKNKLYEWFYIKGVPRLEANEFAGFIGTAININERKSIFNQLEYRKALLEAHNEASLDGILLVDTKGKIISYNHRFIEIWDMPHYITDAKDDEAALTFATTQLVNPDQFIEKVKWLYDHPNEISVDELEFKNGKLIERHGYPVKAIDGSYYAWSWIFRDITEQRKSEQTIKESAVLLQKTTEHFQIATTAAQVGIWSLDVATETLVWSDLHKKMWGYHDLQEDLTYEDWHRLIITEDKEAAFAEVTRALKTKTLYEVSYRIKRVNDGDIRWIHSSGQYFFNEAGEAVSLTGISIDITDQKESEIALTESEKRFRLLADSMPQFVWTADTEGNLNYFNQSVFDYSGLSLEKIIEDGWLQIVHPDDREENIKQWTASVTTGKDFLLEHRFKRYDGEYRWQLSRAVPQKDNEGNITMWVGASTDIQNLKEEEQRKTDFIKMVSHELKTPVTSIKGYVQMLLAMLTGTPETDMNTVPVKPALTRIDEQIKRLTRLITEMLDLSKLEESKLYLQKEKLVLNDLVKETVQDIGFTNKTHNIQIDEHFTGQVYVDKDRIQQVIINLVNNGIKYSPQKQDVHISIAQTIPGTIEVSVTDFGIGISQQEQEKIFDRFYRVDGPLELTFAGFGIGLYITREILAKHDGSIKVSSEPGKGSVFTFTLPLVK
jgi:PAS domain S-box-containing protein